MKKRLILLVLSLIFISTIGTTFAIFTDVIKLGEKNVTSGTVDIEPENIAFKHYDANDKTLINENIAPGDQIALSGTIINSGNLSAKIRINFERTDTAPGIWTLPSISDVVLAPNGTLRLNSFESAIFDKTNPNVAQNKPYLFTITIEAMQYRNTKDIDTEDKWKEVFKKQFKI